MSPGAGRRVPRSGSEPRIDGGGFPRLLLPGTIKGVARSMCRGWGSAGEARDSHDCNAWYRGSSRGRENIPDRASRAKPWTRGHMVIPQGGGKRVLPLAPADTGAVLPFEMVVISPIWVI